MLADQVAVTSEPTAVSRGEKTPPKPTPKPPRRGLGVLVVLALAAAVVGAYFVMAPAKKEASAEGGHAARAEGVRSRGSAPAKPRVEIVNPAKGGMERTTNQPGTIHAFEFARLYAKISGYVKELKVDRGDRVKNGDVLMIIDNPELAAAVAQAESGLVRAQAAVVQAQAKVNSAGETIKARQAMEEKATADFQSATAEREFRAKQYKRISDLVARHAVEEKLQDEELDHYHVALAAELSAKAGIASAKAQVAEAQAFLAEANADLKGAEADVKVAEANLRKEQALYDYTVIKSPYNGVVIFRGEGVHRGSFVQTAISGGNQDDPLLTVARDDRMRTVIPVPDRDVRYCEPGDPAIVRVDAMGDREFKGTVSRMAESEDISDRTMRVEVDLDNPKRELRDGMFGRAEILLEKGTSNLTVPSSCVLQRDSKGKGQVQVVENGKMVRRVVTIGRDDGLRAEIISGLKDSDQVILKPNISMTEGTDVEADHTGAPASAEHKAASAPSSEKHT